jgi:hypothetical protein
VIPLSRGGHVDTADRGPSTPVFGKPVMSRDFVKCDKVTSG